MNDHARHPSGAAARRRKPAAAPADASAALGHEFARPDLLRLALTHSSWANENGRDGRHNERLEFLGDAVLEICVSNALYICFPEMREGEMTRLRSDLVGEASLAARAREQGLDRRLLLGQGEEAQGGRSRDAVLADLFEAVLGAVFLDGGLGAAQGAVERAFSHVWPTCGDAGADRVKDAKTSLQEACQRRFRALPVYSLLETSGPEHAPLFHVAVTLPDGRRFEARGGGCRRAEHDAARIALESLEAEGR